MEERRGDIIMALVLLVVLGTAFIWSLSYGPLTGAFPKLVSGISAAAVVVYLITLKIDGRRAHRAGAKPAVPLETPKAVEHKFDATVVRQQPVGTLRMGLMLPTIYLSAYILVGIVPAVFLFIAGYCWWFGKVRWHKALLAGGVVAIAVYLLFAYVFPYPLYWGILG